MIRRLLRYQVHMLWEGAIQMLGENRYLLPHLKKSPCLHWTTFTCFHKSGYDGPWTPTPTTFNNAYFTLLTSLKWVPKDWKGPPQYVDGATGKLMMLPTDYVLLEDKSFLKWVTAYAKDAAKFDNDFAKAFQKLEENGTKGLRVAEWAWVPVSLIGMHLFMVTIGFYCISCWRIVWFHRINYTYLDRLHFWR